MSEFLLRAWLAGVGVALATGPLGSFVVWRRMAYFGDALAHSALLGVVLSLLFQLPLAPAIALVSMLTGLLLTLLQRQSRFSADTLLGILAHAALSVGLVTLGLTDAVRIDVNAYLFGDILAVSPQDVKSIYLLAAAILAAICYFWRPLVLMTIHQDIAQVEGVPVERMRLTLMLMLSLLVALAIKVIGMLLITSLLIIPAATARYFARTPPQMAAFASLFGMFAVTGGLYASLRWDTPSGPSIVVAALACFFAAFVFGAFRR